MNQYPPPIPVDSQKRHLSILIADDEAAMLEMLTFMLKSFGHQVVAAAKSGGETVRLANKLKPDLIILDIGLPDMDGLEAAKLILAERNVPIIIGTGITREEALERACRLNIQSYLIKPFRHVQLESSIRLAMLRHQLDSTSAPTGMPVETGMTREMNHAVELMIEKFGIDRNEALQKLKTAAKTHACSPMEAAKIIGSMLERAATPLLAGYFQQSKTFSRP